MVGKISRDKAESVRRRFEVRKNIEPELKERLLKVTPQLFGHFLDAKGARRECLACGSSDLFVQVSMTNDHNKPVPDNAESSDNVQENNMITYVTFERINHLAGNSIQNLQYRVSCQNCGFMSSYRAKPVVDWVVIDKKETEEKGGDK
ncbi:hypothetical protein [Serratia plymuthica]|uniref:hypothetical protein n=1 Tax=Serratia plymuthica TaxID=82996 RepID=UPI00141A4847|nr:hypothetical protein [Serratia plymuthica]NIC26554.1 hypothetical protein [Serratia plymuthica]